MHKPGVDGVTYGFERLAPREIGQEIFHSL